MLDASVIHAATLEEELTREAKESQPGWQRSHSFVAGCGSTKIVRT